jgi:FtsP/CotA-like multicopper oxidase with cupredoxin domain
VSRERLRLLLAGLATLAVLAPIGYLWQDSRLPSTYSVMDMGYVDYGGGPRPAADGPAAGDAEGGHGGTGHGGTGHGGTGHGAAGSGRSVRDLTVATDRPADRVVRLVARRQQVRLASGRLVDGYTVNGSTPGPLLRVTRGQLVEVRLHNADVPEGITLHWHGLDVPNAEDGVAGVTQDAVAPGRDHTYRFLADQEGTYWYHSHQVSHEQVVRGLLGPIVVEPESPDRAVRDVVALVHTYAGAATVDGRTSLPVDARPGQRVRVRVINTDNGPTRAWASAPYRVVAVDGHEVHRPGPVTDRATVVTAGGRVDVEVVAPADGSGVRVQLGTGTSVQVGAPVAAPTPPSEVLDLLSYGAPEPLGLDPSQPDRRFTYDVGRRPGFVRGRPGLWWTVNGHLWPNLPAFLVREGDVVRMRIHNGSGDVHPMHLHGHHAVVLSRNGEPATGSPWWVDSLNVRDGERYEIAFVADNPGVWMDHCHNLKHAAEGLVAHLMYEGVTEPYRVGGRAGNLPE